MPTDAAVIRLCAHHARELVAAWDRARRVARLHRQYAAKQRRAR